MHLRPSIEFEHSVGIGLELLLAIRNHQKLGEIGDPEAVCSPPVVGLIGVTS